MKKNLGVSMISLVITIIVIIILAAVAFGSSTDTIENANFSNFANNIAEVQNLLDQQVVALKGIEGKNGVQRTDAQVYNYVAKGATLLDKTGDNWLPRNIAQKMHCTQLSGEAMLKVINYELPKIRVSTPYANGVNCSYFVTNTGTVFVWPPYIYNNELYVNGNTKLIDENGDAYTPESEEVYTKHSTEAYENRRKFKFKIDGVEIIVAPAAIPTYFPTVGAPITFEKFYEKYIHHISFQDGTMSSFGMYFSPSGLEHNNLYSPELEERFKDSSN